MWAVKSSLEISTLFYGFWKLKNRNHQHHQHHHIITASSSLLPKQSTHAEPGGRPLRSIARIQQGQLEKSSNKGGFSSLTGNHWLIREIIPKWLWFRWIYFESWSLDVQLCVLVAGVLYVIVLEAWMWSIEGLTSWVQQGYIIENLRYEQTGPLIVTKRTLGTKWSRLLEGTDIPIPSFLSRTSIESSR